MKTKPVITNKLHTTHVGYDVDLDLKYNITFIVGDSGTGKSAVFSFLEELATEDSRLKCINYLDRQAQYKATIKKSKSRLIIIDNADVLLDDAMREYISRDINNQYVIFGRNPSRLMVTKDNVYELKSSKKGEKIEFCLK